VTRAWANGFDVGGDEEEGPEEVEEEGAEGCDVIMLLMRRCLRIVLRSLLIWLLSADVAER